jgi:hypothetical protein
MVDINHHPNIFLESMQYQHILIISFANATLKNTRIDVDGDIGINQTLTENFPYARNQHAISDTGWAFALVFAHRLTLSDLRINRGIILFLRTIVNNTDIDLEENQIPVTTDLMSKGL